ncbi:helix-turn-helix transcriptional regulator [Chryseobacterium sp. POL2]|uniref:helix-turn-helix domain-containing protein n=1 Tax=Chryseobacterium sp. POL2 TaxID=2713414 RepID=UPI0013E1791B|nr:response regulator transcription factor [Chryseobacterium sp. POL2]QIG88409.1 helix-turn-helix transcriptional regulator [Chryseobacterium sp. POL2]
MNFDGIKVFSQENLLEHLVVGHPYYPTKPAFFMLKKGNLKLKEQINIHNLSEFSIVLLDTASVYEIIEYSKDIEIQIVVYEREFIEKLNLRFNRLNAFRAIKLELRKSYQSTENEFMALWNNVLNIQYYLSNSEKQEYGMEVLESFFTAFIYQLANIVSYQRKISKQKMSRSQETALSFIRLVSIHFKQERSVEFYANKLMLSSRHLTVVLKEIFGKSAIQIINEFILNEAKAQLSSTSKPINEIASQLQFSDQYSFSHFFKKHENLSPKEYRNQF